MKTQTRFGNLIECPTRYKIIAAAFRISPLCFKEDHTPCEIMKDKKFSFAFFLKIKKDTNNLEY